MYIVQILKMLIKKYNYQAFFFLVVFMTFLLGSLVKNNILLTDDLAFVDNARFAKHKNFFEYIYSFMNTETMTSRPVSAFITALITYASSYYERFYYLAYLFFIISVFFVFKITQIFTKNFFFSIATVFLYVFLPVGNALVFSPIMLNSALANIFYCSSLIFLLKEQKHKYDVIYSALFFLLSILSYEIFLPLILSNLFLIKKRKISYLAGIIITYLIYKKIIEPSLFENYYHREQVNILLNIKRDFKILLKSIKVIIYDLSISVIRAIKAIRYYSFQDFMSLILISTSFLYFISRNKIEGKPFEKTPNLIHFLISSLILSFTIFLVSNYEPSIKGFSSRTMGGIRLYFSFFLMYIFIKYRLKTLFSITIIIFIINSISVKNALQYSSEINNEIFKKISLKKITTKKAPYLYIVFNKENINLKKEFSDKQKEDRNYFFRRDQFVAEEPIFFAPWESDYLKHKFNIEKKINIEYYFYNDKVKTKPYYLFDFHRNNLLLIK